MPNSRRLLLFALSLIVTLTISGSLVLALQNAGAETPEQVIAVALERARAQESFHTVADIDQTLIPRPVPANRGQRDQRTSMRILGDVAQSTRFDGSEERRARLQFYAETEEAPVEMILAGSKAYVGYQGKWQEVEDPLGGVAPGGDTLGYLVAARDVAEVETVVTTAEGKFRRYTFTLDGDRYAEYQRDRMQHMLSGRLPQGTELKKNPQLVAMSGEGELWLDAEGLPRRQILNLNMPEASERYEAQVHMIIDFTRFGDHIPAIQLPQASAESGALVLPEPSQSPSEKTSQAASSLNIELVAKALRPLSPLALRVFIILPLLIVALLLVRRKRTLYTAVVIAMIVLMVVQPLLQAGQYTFVFNRAAEASTLEEALQELAAPPQQENTGGEPMQQVLSDLAGGIADTGDLNDCRTLFVDTGSQPADDDDGDGLSNETEWCLGTIHTDVDSDGDGITDTVELAGFTDGNGKKWWSDPLQADSNNDGMTDGGEWDPALINATGTYTDSFTDKDNDGVPNLWDEDNDGDEVPDSLDISPYRVMPNRESFTVTVSDHNAGTSVYVDVQLQPKNLTHLRYNLTSLDWPSDDKGQIQEHNDSLGDITLLPVLEIKYHSEIAPSLASLYSIAYTSVSSEPADGYLLWAPLQAVTSRGAIYAFSARLPFNSAEADKGIKLSEAKILWLTQAELDSCQVTTDDPCKRVVTTGSTIASYYEPKFRVTGLNVVESKDIEVGLFGTSA
ncbi:MAG: hypothetical protein GY753_18440, partial [Gammaproteobacteria bacterium]|nr:hypothetical protein [Gammaproteobacteria bacterium]